MTEREPDNQPAQHSTVETTPEVDRAAEIAEAENLAADLDRQYRAQGGVKTLAEQDVLFLARARARDLRRRDTEAEIGKMRERRRADRADR